MNIEQKNEKREFILPTAERTLHVIRSMCATDHLTYWRRSGNWECVGTSRKLEFLSVVPIDEIENAVTKLGWKWRWNNPPDDKITKRSLEYKRKHGGSF